MKSNLEMLENELLLMLDNIQRVKTYAKSEDNSYMNRSLVVGELKHRGIALKQRLTIVNQDSTSDVIKSLRDESGK